MDDTITTMAGADRFSCRHSETPGLRVPFGRSVLNGLSYEPRAVPLGKDCQCECPACRQPLYAKHCLDSNITPHFQHASGATCRYGYETAIHFAAKQLIEEERRLFFPELSADVHIRDAWGLLLDARECVVKAGVRALSEVVIEQNLGELRPDLFVTVDDLGSVLVEVAVTHFVKSEKLEKARRIGRPLLELDLSELRNASFSELRELIFNRADNRKWLFHPEHGPVIAWLESGLRPLLDASQNSKDAIEAELDKRYEFERKELEQNRRQAEAAQRVAAQQEQDRAADFKKLPEKEKAEVLVRWLKRDDLSQLTSFPVRGDGSFGLTNAWIWQAALFANLLHKLTVSETTWVTPDEMVTWLSLRFSLTPEFPDSEKRAVSNYLNGLCERGAMAEAGGRRFRPAVASLSAYALQLAVRSREIEPEHLTWVDEVSWPHATAACRIAEALANVSCLPAAWQRISSVLPVARSQSPLSIARMYGRSGLGANWALRYLICGGFLQAATRTAATSQ